MSPRNGDWICTYTGVSFYPFDPRKEDVRIEDIGHALGNLCRFGGHCRWFYSVAEHSVRAFKEAQFRGATRRQQRGVLLHDAAEAYVIDVPRPIKKSLQGYNEIESGIEAVLADMFDFDPHDPIIKELDEVMLATEKRDLMPATSLAWASLPEPLPKPIQPWEPSKAMFAFRLAWLYCGWPCP